MKKFKLSKLIIIFIAFFLISASLIFFISKNKSLREEVSSVINSSVDTVKEVIDMPVYLVNQSFSSINELFNTFKENDRLREELSKLETQDKEYQILLEENKELRSILGVKESFEGLNVLTGKVIMRSPIAWLDYVTVDIGKYDGVLDDMLLVSNGGLAGKIEKINASTTDVTLITNLSNTDGIPVKIKTSKEDVYGVLTDYDEKENLLVISQLNTRQAISSGDEVFTSGLDGQSVSDISVGKVKMIDDKEPLNIKIYVVPTVDFSNLSYVSLIGE
ncbi:rod shape-determining protein MreC [Streptococcus sp. CSL10205-OR2]|uniref:rod shape-determining protein MreC n=1 Tax=Streptococcus sp. CSL10205-OR2 TaxID=2980558 RepID=UPI0021DAB808|nr:rod shape-determining protein MreC [Streptococcus sp. CSL10205-OR2]MCU9534437.1 rod shape-determining protein MreC [Streptococcus sp. CSL10205-OR2]